MYKTILAISLCSLSFSAAYADDSAQPAASTTTTTTAATSLDVTGPQEVGTTTMPAGNYMITEQTSGKTYDLMVSNKGTMILAPAPKAGAATAPAATTTGTTSSTSSFGVKGLMQKGLEKGVTQGVTNMMEKNATNELGKFIK